MGLSDLIAIFVKFGVMELNSRLLDFTIDARWSRIYVMPFELIENNTNLRCPWTQTGRVKPNFSSITLRNIRNSGKTILTLMILLDSFYLTVFNERLSESVPASRLSI